MLSIRFLFALLIGSWFAQVHAQEVVKDIRFIGLKKTNPDYLERFIGIKVGSTFDSVQVLEDIQILKNLRIFDEVSYSTEDTLQGIILNFHLNEVFTLLPIANFGGIAGNFWFQLSFLLSVPTRR